MAELSQAAREELALALILWKDFKSEGQLDIKIMKSAIAFAQHLGVHEEFEKLLSIIPSMKIEKRYP